MSDARQAIAAAEEADAARLSPVPLTDARLAGTSKCGARKEPRD